MKKYFIKKRVEIILGLIFVVARFLRQYKISSLGIWFDEVFSILAISEKIPLNDLVGFNPPAYFFFVRVWVSIFGEEIFILRLFSVFWALISIIMVYYLAKLIFNKKIGLISAFLLSISPVHIYYSREIRAYSFLLSLTILSMCFMVSFIKKNNFLNYILYVIFTLVAVFTNVSGLLVLAAQVLYMVFLYKKEKKITLLLLLSQVLILILIYPMLINLLSVINSTDVAWMPSVCFTSIFYVFNMLNLGYNSSKLLYVLIFLSVSPFFIKGIWYAMKEEKINGIALALWFFFPFLILIIMSIYPFKGGFVQRYLLIIAPAYYIFIACTLADIKISWFFKAGLLMAVFYSQVNLFRDNFMLPENPYHIGEHARHQIKESLFFIEQHYNSSDIIVHTTWATALPAFVYLKENKGNIKKNMYVISEPYSAAMLVSLPENIQKIYKHNVISLSEEIQTDKNTIWLVKADWESASDLVEACCCIKNIKEWFDKEFELVMSAAFRGIRLYRYV